MDVELASINHLFHATFWELFNVKHLYSIVKIMMSVRCGHTYLQTHASL
jgi:hypothetical protein